MNLANDSTTGFRNIANLKITSTSDLKTIRKIGLTEGIFEIINDRIINKDIYEGLTIRGGLNDDRDLENQGLTLESHPYYTSAEGLKYASSRLTVANPVLRWKGIIETETTLTDPLGNTYQEYDNEEDTRILVTKNGELNWYYMGNLPDYIKFLEQDQYRQEALAGLALGLATLAGLLGLSPANIRNWGNTIGQKLGKAVDDALNEEATIRYTKISHRPFGTNNAGDLCVPEILYLTNFSRISVIPNGNIQIDANNNPVFSSGNEYIILDGNSKTITCQYLDAKQTLKINGVTRMDANYTYNGDWRYNEEGIQHQRDNGRWYKVVSFFQKGDVVNYVFHGTATGDSSIRAGDQGVPASRPSRTVQRGLLNRIINQATGGEGSPIQDTSLPSTSTQVQHPTAKPTLNAKTQDVLANIEDSGNKSLTIASNKAQEKGFSFMCHLNEAGRKFKEAFKPRKLAEAIEAIPEKAEEAKINIGAQIEHAGVEIRRRKALGLVKYNKITGANDKPAGSN